MDKYQSWKAKVFHFGTEQLCQRAIHEWLRWDLWKILTFWQNSDCFRTPLQQKVRIRTQKENSDQSGSSALCKSKKDNFSGVLLVKNIHLKIGIIFYVLLFYILDWVLKINECKILTRVFYPKLLGKYVINSH